MIFYINHWQEQGDSPVLVTGLVDGDVRQPAMLRVEHSMFRNFIEDNNNATMPVIAKIDEDEQTITAILRN